MTAHYYIEDEPRPGVMAALAVNPLWPLLGLMLGGFLFGIAWFIVNGVAVGSPTRGREILVAFAGLAAVAATSILVLFLIGAGTLPQGPMTEYALLPLVLIKLSFGYVLFAWQARTIEIYESFGGQIRNGMPIVIVGFFLRPVILGALPYTLWRMVAS